jgi:hypothetical protein
VCFGHSASASILCPLEQPKKAIGHEPQIELWLAPSNHCACPLSGIDWCRHERKMTCRGSKSRRFSASRAYTHITLESAAINYGRGLMSSLIFSPGFRSTERFFSCMCGENNSGLKSIIVQSTRGELLMLIVSGSLPVWSAIRKMESPTALADFGSDAREVELSKRCPSSQVQPFTVYGSCRK